MKLNSGFTLIEMLLSVSIIGVMALMSVPVYQSFQTRNDLDITATSVAESIRRGQVLAQGMDGDTLWGVRIETGNIVIFKGSSFTLRDSEFDEVFAVPASITPSGISEITFAKLSGLPSVNGTITLTSSANETRNISINQKGMVSL
ncbi:MAG: type II secretion system GspH family protein [bacterium]|nr:type II secretion system GspH family protein [bacterium]